MLSCDSLGKVERCNLDGLKIILVGH